MISEETVQEVLTTLDQITRDYQEKAEAYMELVRIATRMADRLPDDDPDRLALEAMFMFHIADSVGRTRRLQERSE